MKTAKCLICKKRFRIEGFSRKTPEWCYTCNVACDAFVGMLMGFQGYYGPARLSFFLDQQNAVCKELVVKQ